MKNPKTLILSGMGLNCEKETAYACEKSGAGQVDVLHTLRFLEGKTKLKEYGFLIFIGGFLDGDYLGSARVGANRFKFGSSQDIELKEELKEFVVAGHLILGICNGFQLLVKLGLLPDEDQAFEQQTVSLTQNQKGIFENRWVHLKVNDKNRNVFTRGIGKTYLPVRHGEGRIVVTDKTAREKILSENRIAMHYADDKGEPTDTYPANPNGSWRNIAALSNKKGNILGMMPHPEAYNHYTNHPHWTRLRFPSEDGEGLTIFKNAYNYLKS
ncbi:MAG: phosphoribosylformylglycinamidine synthase subunit PurQ [Proteobacteria bacterium]|nr:phosphoribosylformylglycinamidine synthase subunit PurQ [Pseudomonadota bacterium]